MDLSVEETINELELEETCTAITVKCGNCHSTFSTKVELEAHCLDEHVQLPSFVKENQTKIQTVAREENCPEPVVEHIEVKEVTEVADNVPEIIAEVSDVMGKMPEVVVDVPETVDNISVTMEVNPVTSENQTYSCGKCDNKYSSLIDVNSHIDQHHKQIVVDAVDPVEIEPLQSCDRCDFETESKEDLNTHYVKNIHIVQDKNKSLIEVECKKCQKKFDNNTSLERHMAEDHTEDAKQADEECITVLEDEGEIIADIQDESVEKSPAPVSSQTSFSCRKCSKRFDNKGNLEKHVDEEHIILNVYNCASCKHKTTALQEHRLHMAIGYTPCPEET